MTVQGVHHGKAGKVKLTTNLVAEVSKFSVAESIPTADTTVMGTAAETHLVGIPSWTAKVEGNYSPVDATGQAVLTIGASVTVGLYTDGDATGKEYLTGTASVVGRSVDASKDDKVTFSADLKGNGALSKAVVPA
jgi:predicted secreted protein